MKKFKKISAMLMASVMTAGTVSAMSAGALAHFNTKEEMDNFIENGFMIPYENDWTENDYYPGMYLVETGYDNRYDFFDIYDIRADLITAVLDADIDADSLEKAVSEICPDAEHLRTFVVNKGLYFEIAGFDDYLPYAEARKKDLTEAQINKVYDFLNNTGKLKEFEVCKRTVNSGRTRSNLTVYDKERNGINYREMIENYISENNLPWKIKDGGGYYNFNNFQIVPDEKFSIAERYDLAERIYKELNICPTIIFPSSASISEDITIDMHTNIKGDANDDGELRLSDAITILQAIGNPDEYHLSPQGSYNADIYGDRDGLTAMDAVAVQQKILGLE